MPELPLTLSLFLYLYGAYMAVYVLYSLFNIYHLAKYGVYDLSLYALIIVFAAGTIVLIAASVLLLLPYDWTAPISVREFIPLQETERVFPTL